LTRTIRFYRIAAGFSKNSCQPSAISRQLSAISYQHQRRYTTGTRPPSVRETQQHSFCVL
jgi:hypothetical protein